VSDHETLESSPYSGLNRLELHAILTGKKTMRYTPAGVPVQEVVLLHRSEQGSESVRRKIAFECPAVAFGSMALLLENMSEQAVAVFEGYLAPQYSTHSRWVLHIHRFNLES